MHRLLSLLLLIQSTVSYKFLVYSPQIANSHVNFLARISDALIDAGHEVVMLSPIHDPGVGGPGTRKARVIELPQPEAAKEMERFMQGKGPMDIWKLDNILQMYRNMDSLKQFSVKACEEMLRYPGLIEALRNESFDVAYSESMDLCFTGLFHLVGVKKTVVTESMAIWDANFHITQTPSLPSYVPSTMKGEYGESMSLLERALNSVSFYFMQIVVNRDLARHQDMFRSNWPTIPSITELASSASLVFFNSEPLVDFPRPTSSRVIDIGGISVSAGHKPVNRTWSDILHLRPKTVLMSFGTFAKSHLMPEEYKETIRQTLAKFPEVTFIWKYEKPEHNVSRGISNIIETTWVPQHDILHDPRLTAFITHCGQGSTTEAYSAGIPLIVIPVLADQLRNAQQVKRNGVGITLSKTDLAQVGPFEEAIRRILTDDRYKKRAVQVQTMLNERPFTMKEIFVRNMEFIAKYGPLRQLDHYGRHLNFLQYYLIDVISILSLALVTIVAIGLYLAYYTLSLLSTIIVIKKKKD